MAQIVAVHGIGQQFKDEDLLLAEWGPAMRSSLRRAGIDPSTVEIRCVFYGDLFLPRGKKSIGLPPLTAADLESDWERELLAAWWTHAAKIEPGVTGPDARTKVRTPRLVQRGLSALSRSTFFAGLAERALIADLKQVHAYLNDTTVRRAIRGRITQALGPDVCVVVAHSLGSVAAYEALCAGARQEDGPLVRALVTLGSPLGIRNLIFDQLEPGPTRGTGRWPPVRDWVNIADGGDVVALEKELAPLFGGGVADHLVYNGSSAHSVQPYLSAAETGEAIAAGLR